jgi:hypothetical protein
MKPFGEGGVMAEWLAAIFCCAGLAYLAVGFVVLFRRLRQRGLSAPTSSDGGFGDIAPFIVVAALWPLYLRGPSGPGERED